jgi:carbonic anhydrase
MKELIAGVKKFQRDVFPQHRELFQQLAGGQSPEVLVISCSDSRVDLNLVTQARPGRIFELRNAGNIVPRFTSFVGGVTATIEFAVVALQVSNIIICGHSGCGAMSGLLAPENLERMPNVKRWLENAAEVPERLADTASSNSSDMLQRAVETNIIVQLEHLRTHPCVAEAWDSGRLALHGWVYDIPSGTVHACNEAAERFEPL